MATTTGSINVYDDFKQYMADGSMDLDGDTFIMGLSTSTYTPADTHSVIADITNEVSGSGYARQTLTSVTWTEPSAGVWMFDSANPVFTASGGSIVGHYYWVFDDTPSSPLDPLCWYGFLDDTPADVTTTDGNTLTVTVHASGFFRLSGG